MSAPKRVQMTRNRPWRADHPDAVIVDRRTKWGNPFRADDYPRTVATIDGDDVVALPPAERQRFAVLDFEALVRHAIGGREHYPSEDEIRSELAGRDLACWCKPGDPCHADVLLELANAPSSVRAVSDTEHPTPGDQ